MLLSAVLTAQSGVLHGHFLNYDVTNGLSNRNINCITQDSRGMIWIGTEEGLNRFDGVHFKWYLSDDGEGAIPDNDVNHIVPLEDGKLWVALAGRGMALYLPESDSFEPVVWESPDSSRLATNVQFIFENEDKQLWLACRNSALHEGGLVTMNPADMTTTFISDELKINPYHIVKDPNNPDLLWLAGSRFGWYNMKTGKFGLENFQGDGANKIRSYQWITPRSDGRFLVSTWGRGLIEFDPQSKTWGTPVVYDKNEVYTSQRNAVRRLVHKKDSTYWVMTADAGFGEYDASTNQFAFYEHEDTNPFSIWHISARDVYEDQQGIVWVGMASGLSILNPYVQQINYKPIPIGSNQNNQHFKFNHASRIGDKLLLAGSYADGYYLLDPETKELKRKIGTGQDLGITTGLSGVALFAGEDGQFYSMVRNDLWRIDASTLEATEILDLEKVTGRKGYQSNINTLLRASDGSIWLGTDDNTLYQYWPETGVLKDFLLEEREKIAMYNLIFELAEDDQGQIWVAAHYGIYRVDREGNIAPLRDLSPSYAKQEPQEILSLVSTGNKVVCGTARNGLMVYNIQTGEIQQLGHKEGMLSLTVSEMVVDQHHDVWGITGNGLFRYHNDSGRIDWFTTGDGLKYYDLVNNDISVLENGEIILGFDQGIGYFHPDSLISQPLPFGLTFLEARADGNLLVTERALDFHPQITLKPNEERLEITLQALGYIHPKAYTYRYRIKDMQEEWTVTNRGLAVFSELEAGDHVLQVQVGNTEGQWLDTLYTLDVEKRVDFWETRWFVLLGLFVLVGMIVLLFKWRISTERNKSNLKQEYDKRIVDLEMMAFRAQMNPHFLFNCLNSIKYFIIREETDRASDYLTKFGRLIRLILQNSALEVIPLSSELEALELYVELEMVRLDNKFSYEIVVEKDVETDFIEIPPLVIQPFVENAIWHGLLNRENPGGKLSVHIRRTEFVLYCKIQDNGIGRKKAAELKTTSARSKRSMGMEITKNRLVRFKDSLNANAMHIEDLEDSAGNILGTCVHIEIAI